MPRDSAGNYNLPLAPVVGGETIKADAWANPTLEDMRLALESSLSRDGQGGMRAPLPFGDGTATAPSVTFTSETSSGIYRAGSQDIRLSVGGVDVMQYLGDRALTLNPESSQLEQIATVPMLSDLELPEGTIEGQRITWDQTAGEWVLADPLTATVTPYDNSTSGLSAENVQSAIDEHVGDEDIHYSDAPADSVPRARMDNAWVSTLETVGSDKPTKLEVVSSLPGSPDADTVYIVTG